MFGRLFDERFRSAAAGVHAYWPVRLTLAGVICGFLGLGAGWTAAVMWFGAALASEAAMLTATRIISRSPNAGPVANWSCFAIYALAISTWSCAGVILWSSPSPAANIAAAAFFAGHLLYFHVHHAHSLGAALPTLPSILAPTIVPVAMPHFTGADQWIVSLALDAVVLHALISLFVSLRRSKELLEAQGAMSAASQAKSEFLARMSHEIRTPLNGVLGMTQALAAEPDLQPAHRERVAVIRRSGEALLSILNDVLDLSKVEAGKLDLEEIAFDLGQLVEGAREAFAPQAEAKGLGFHVGLEAAAAGTYRGDPTRVRQILYNLLSNAVKFTERGEIRLTVARAAELLVITVADSGIGIAPEHLDRLFGRFQQVDSSTTRRYGGSGLGLSICRELAELMGGEIEVDSRAGAGSRFHVTLPLPRVGEAAPERAKEAPAGEFADGRELRILAAEDNPVNQLVLATLLGQAGLEPVVVDDGAQAVDAWRTGAFDLILMDVQMPVMDGVAATRAIRAAEAAEGRPRIPILALTANAMQHQVAEYLAAGLDGHVAKPIDARALLEAIAQAVEPRVRAESSAA